MEKLDQAPCLQCLLCPCYNSFALDDSRIPTTFSEGSYSGMVYWWNVCCHGCSYFSLGHLAAFGKLHPAIPSKAHNKVGLNT